MFRMPSSGRGPQRSVPIWGHRGPPKGLQPVSAVLFPTMPLLTPCISAKLKAPCAPQTHGLPWLMSSTTWGLFLSILCTYPGPSLPNPGLIVNSILLWSVNWFDVSLFKPSSGSVEPIILSTPCSVLEVQKTCSDFTVSDLLPNLQFSGDRESGLVNFYRFGLPLSQCSWYFDGYRVLTRG